MPESEDSVPLQGGSAFGLRVPRSDGAGANVRADLARPRSVDVTQAGLRWDGSAGASPLTSPLLSPSPTPSLPSPTPRGDDAELDDTDIAMQAFNDSHWESSSTLPINEKSASDLALDDAFDTYHLEPDSLAPDIASQQHVGWTEYLPTNAREAGTPHEPSVPDDEESAPEKEDHAARLSQMLRNIANSSRRAFEHARRNKMSARGMQDESEWVPMQEACAAGETGPAQRRPIHEQLRGHTLLLFGPTHPLRVSLARILSSWWIEPLVLGVILMHLVVLIVWSSHNVQYNPRTSDSLSRPEQIIMLIVFVLYTIEMLARIIVSGFVINPPVSGDVTRSNTLDVLYDLYSYFALQAQRFLYPYNPELQRRTAEKLEGVQPTEGVAVTDKEESLEPPEIAETGIGHAVLHSFVTVGLHLSRAITGDPQVLCGRAYLRHSWHRVDAVAIFGYWIAMALQQHHQEETHQHYVFIFRALSVLRCARLMALWDGTATILLSLKRVAPLLMRVVYFIVYCMLLFAVIGIQSFKGSYRRHCVWIGDYNNEQGQNYTLQQLCGGSVDPEDSSRHIGAISFGEQVASSDTPKGFICPFGQLCMEQPKNPFNNVQSFDNVFAALVEVAVIMSLNGWSDTMYDMIDADYYTACIFFIFGVILLNFWLANLFVAVISHSFASLSAQTQRSAFAAVNVRKAAPESEQLHTTRRHRRRRVVETYQRMRRYTQYFWLALIVLSVAVQASQASYQFPSQREWRIQVERYLTVAFGVEMLVRIVFAWLDADLAGFWRRPRNVADMFLAVITVVIQVPVIHHSGWYPWLTFFQLARFYRVIAAIPRMRMLLFRVFGSMNAIFNMIALLLMTIFLAALFSSMLFRGTVAETDSEGEDYEMRWSQLFNAFLGVYQVFSSEDWSKTLFNVVSSNRPYGQGVIAAIFLIGWFVFANFILLQMFIAVINENFRVAEGDKYKQQMERYLRRSEPPKQSLLARIMQRLSPFRAPHPQAASTTGAQVLHHLPQQEAALLAPIVEQLNAIAGPTAPAENKPPRSQFMHLVVPESAGLAVGTLQRVLRLDKPREHARLKVMQQERERPPAERRRTLYDLEEMIYESEDARPLVDRQHLRTMRTDLGLTDTERSAEFLEDYVTRPERDPRIQLARMMAEHPWYDRSWFIFSNRSPVRRFCQSLTPCSHGERMFGRPMSRWRNYMFQTVVLAAIVGSVVAAGIATPEYRKQFFVSHSEVIGSWFSGVELGLSIIFVLEFFVKTIADGFAFTPNAYLLSVWNLLDMFVLISLLINVISELVVPGGVSDFTRALKAFRALRLINLSSLMRDTFHAVMIAGAGHILDASMLALLYIIPYAVWGQNLFAGLLYSCSDSSDSIRTKLDCHGEYASQPLSWKFLAPRVWRNPTEGSHYSFDDFKSALLVLFEIVSLEGWIDVMTRAMSIVGRDMQPQADASQHNAIFFLVYNLIGAVTVLTLFVSVIIENFQRYSGAAYLTTEQRQWLDLKRQLQRQGASKRPPRRPEHPVLRWCYDAATWKQGWWSRSMSGVYFIMFILLMSQTYGDSVGVERGRSIAYALIGFACLADIVVRLVGLGFNSFRRSLWNWYDVIVTVGVLCTSIPSTLYPNTSQVHAQLLKIFCTGVTLKLVQRSDAMNQLFKTAVGSLPAIIALFLLWLTMFLTWGIMLVEVFGLTRWGQNETHAKNFRTLWGTLVFLLMTSTGEGWNAYMHDFAVQPPLCTPSSNYLESDCGSVSWSYFLFITWNVISMFIFLNMFTGTVVENFSYVYHLQGSKALSRDQMRRYKAAWSRFDPTGSGYIPRSEVIPFLAQLDGMFEVGLYPPRGRIAALMESSRAGSTLSPSGSPRRRFRLPRSPRSRRGSSSGGGSDQGSRSPRSDRENASVPSSPPSSPRMSPFVSPLASPADAPTPSDVRAFEWPAPRTERIAYGIDLDKLEDALSRLDPQELRMRRQRLNRIYHEAISSDKGRGVSFTAMLFVLAYHKLVARPTNLEVSEFIERRAEMDRIDSAINLERVRGLLRTVYVRRRFLALRAGETYRGVAIESDERGLPSITVERDLSVGGASDNPFAHNTTRVETPNNPFSGGSVVSESSPSNPFAGGSARGASPSEPRTPSAHPTISVHIPSPQSAQGSRLDTLRLHTPSTDPNMLHTPTRQRSDYFDMASGDAAMASDVQLSPLSASGARRRLSFNSRTDNPWAESPDHLGLWHSELHAPYEPGAAPTVSSDDKWMEVLRRLSDDGRESE